MKITFIVIILISMMSLFAQDDITPPFKKVWTFSSEEQLEQFIVVDDVIYYAAFDSYGAVDLATGKSIWSKNIPEEGSGSSLAYDDKNLYIAAGKYKLFAYDRTTFKELWSLPKKNYAGPMVLYSNTLFCSLHCGILSAINIDTHSIVWEIDMRSRATKDVKNEEYPTFHEMQVLDDRLIVTMYTGDMFVIDSKNGSILWQYKVCEKDETKCPSISGFAHDGEKIYLATSKQNLIVLQLNNGKKLFQADTEDDLGRISVMPDGNLLVAAIGGKIYAFDTDTGKEKWSKRLSMAIGIGSDISPPVIHNQKVYVSDDSKLYAFDTSGEQLWEWDTEEDLFAMPIILLQDGVILADARELYRFTMGSPPELPMTTSARLKLAQELVSRFDKLSKDEKRTLGKLGDEAFSALLPKVKELIDAKADNKKASAGTTDEKLREEGYNLYSQLSDALEIFAEVASKKHTQDLLSIYEDAKRSGFSGEIIDLLSQKGDETLTVPLYISILKNWQSGKSGSEEEPLYAALEAIGKSSNPMAVNFLIKKLADNKAPPEIRHEAFVNLARTGGNEGVNAVLAAKDYDRLHITLSQFMGIDKLGIQTRSQNGSDDDACDCCGYFRSPSRLLQTHKDEQGVLWSLVSSYIIGSNGNLWIARHDGKKWTAPVFTGMTEKELGSKNWFEEYIGNSALTKDSDSDGWTDMVEDVLGTDPDNADTDGDKLKDSLDKNPLATHRQLSEEEQIIAAAFEARIRFIGWRNFPCLVKFPKGMKPFELFGWHWIILPKDPNWEMEDEWTGPYGAVVTFAKPMIDFEGVIDFDASGKKEDIILWNNNKTEARIHIIIWHGSLDATGYDVHLKKIDGKWLVIKLLSMWIS